MRRKPGVTFNCFSPPIMLATFIIEIILASYTFGRYRLNSLTRVIITALFFLALFQLSEYFVCGGAGLRAGTWARIGFVSITTLPPLGLHMFHILAHKRRRRLVAVAYITMAAFMVYFTTFHSVFTGYACTGNYVIFQIGQHPAIFYGLYYYGWLATGIVLGWRWGKHLRGRQLNTVQALILGYLVFLVPTALANSVSPATRRGIPSIMCGFAVLFAFILVFYIVPQARKVHPTDS